MGERILDPAREERFYAAMQRAEDFFMGNAAVQRAMRKIAHRLEELDIPYAVVGAMAMNEYGFERVTTDVDLLMTREALESFKRHWLGRGYVEKFPGSRALRDTQENVTIDVLVTGAYPGDGQPKPIAFPDPSQEAYRGKTVSLLPIERLIELKVASGMSAPHRLKDLADVIELIKACNLPLDLDVHEYVRAKYRELWDAAQHRDPE
jgi:hypothetical protein